MLEKLFNVPLQVPIKKQRLELGGKAANIIFDDAPIDQAVEGVINGIFFNQGHVCCAGSRLYVQESVFKEVVRKLKDRLETLIVGDPMDKNTDIGAINSKEQLDIINKYIKIGQQEGAEMYQSSCAIPEKRILLQAYHLYQCCTKQSHCTGRNFWPGTGDSDFQNR